MFSIVMTVVILIIIAVIIKMIINKVKGKDELDGLINIKPQKKK